MKKPDLKILPEKLTGEIMLAYNSSNDEYEFVEALKCWIYENLSLLKNQPIDYVRWVNVDDVIANDYNPNAVAIKEMQLLHKSIKSDGITQPVVVVETHRYIVRFGDILLSLSDDNIRDNKIWNFLEDLQKRLLPTQQPLLMPMEASTSIQNVIDTQSEFFNRKKMGEQSFWSGSESSGDLVQYTLTTEAIATKEIQKCIAGLLPRWKSATTWQVLSLNIKGSKDIKANSLQNTIILFLPLEGSMENGMMLRINFFEKTGIPAPIENYLKHLKEVSAQLDIEERYSDLSVQNNSKFVIVDGFHRTTIMKNYKDIQETTGRRLPVVVLDKDINERMAATVRHNRARGTHSVVSMSDMVFSMLEKGMDDAAIANELGMEAEEVVRLKHITGFSKLFKDKEYSKAWETKHQILLRKKYETENTDKADTTAENKGE